MDKTNQARILKRIRDEVREVTDQFIARPYTTENSKELSKQLKGNLDNWINSLGLNHIYTGCEVVSIEDGVAKMNIKTNLLELKKAVEEMEVSFEVLIGYKFQLIEARKIKRGMKFRQVNDGVPERKIYTATKDAYYDGIEELWCIDIEQ